MARSPIATGAGFYKGRKMETYETRKVIKEERFLIKKPVTCAAKTC